MELILYPCPGSPRVGTRPVLVLASHYLRAAAAKVLLDNGAETNRDDVADFPVFGHLAWALSDKLDEDKESATNLRSRLLRRALMEFSFTRSREERLSLRTDCRSTSRIWGAPGT
ncbi:hypothetical protein GGR55DRAFT_676722 [Xylaria sp. FL0064]|nr:hypothetical protein GGR55DRAFT_676722 [Xylaria sp. FL0064]